MKDVILLSVYAFVSIVFGLSIIPDSARTDNLWAIDLLLALCNAWFFIDTYRAIKKKAEADEPA